jgi:hypothetical protein
MNVSSPKTEHLEGRAYRVVSIFARLRPYLEEVWEVAEAGDVYAVGGRQVDHYRTTSQKPGGWINTHLRTSFRKLVRRAGLTAWPRLFQNLRSSLETDLVQDHPIHVVTAWVVVAPRIALGHYPQPVEGDFEKDIRGGAEAGTRAAQTPADGKDPERTLSAEVQVDGAVSPLGGILS